MNYKFMNYKFWVNSKGILSANPLAWRTVTMVQRNTKSSLEIGLKIEYNITELPYFMQWKSIASGDFVVGLEPANFSVYGKPYHIKEHSLHQMEPFAVEKKRMVGK